MLSSYGFPVETTAGRVYKEKPHPYRNPFQRDRDRIVHCAAFRRLSEKMQVFTAEFGDYHRTRLTHTLEVSCAARTIGRALGLNEDLIEAAALLHDIGHPPFGHTGEETLDQLLAGEGGFNHNAQALRIVEKLEHRYADFPGLNLSKEILNGQRYKFEKTVIPLLEIQVVDVADSIAYDTHDVDDAMELGLLTAPQLMQTSLWKESAYRVRQLWTALDDSEFRRAAVHDLIDRQISDVLRSSEQRLKEQETPFSARGILIAPSTELAEQKREMEQFLLNNVYRHPKLTKHRQKIVKRMKHLWKPIITGVQPLPERYARVVQEEGIRRAAADFIADQTDRLRQQQRSDTSFPRDTKNRR